MMRSRTDVLQDQSLQGVEFCHALSLVVDEWLIEIFDEACVQLKPKGSVALVAVGGYGREELAPFSDLDLLLLHDSVKKIDEFAAKIWYPIWDSGFKLGHAVRTKKETLRLASQDLDTATGILTARYLAGDQRLADDLISNGRRNWSEKGRGWLSELHRRVLERHRKAGEIAFLLEPDLKEGMGGLRDIQTIWWALGAGLVLSTEDRTVLEHCYELLTKARVALHRTTSQPGDILHLDDQDAVASALGFISADVLMAELATAGRQVMWVADEAWARLDPPQSIGVQLLAPGVEMRDGFVHLEDDADPSADPTLVLRVATAAARHNARINRESLNRLGELTPTWPDPWMAGASDDLVALLLEGHNAIPVLEALDQRDLIVRVLPEWKPVRSKPQRNAYHRFTVDRHLWETVANAAALADTVARPDLLVLGAWFHDLGKGYPGDHTDVGVELFNTIGPRMGLSPDDVDIVQLLIRHHLLLADTATRRDLSDDATITGVANKVKSAPALDLLHALTIADSQATGPSAWGSWKAGLVDELAKRVRYVLGGGDVHDVVWRLFPDAEVLELMAARDLAIRITVDEVTVVSPDMPGTFSKVAGVLSLHGLYVLGAEAHSDEPSVDKEGVYKHGMAASQFRVAPPSYGPIDWGPVEQNLRRAFANQLAIEARLAIREKTYQRPRPTTAVPPPAPTVRFDDSASSHSTFIEVRAPDRVGILYRITKALAELGLDIRHARVQTLGNEVVDAFYVRNSDGTLLRDSFHRQEVERAILHAVTR